MSLVFGLARPDLPSRAGTVGEAGLPSWRHVLRTWLCPSLSRSGRKPRHAESARAATLLVCLHGSHGGRQRASVERAQRWCHVSDERRGTRRAQTPVPCRGMQRSDLHHAGGVRTDRNSRPSAWPSHRSRGRSDPEARSAPLTTSDSPLFVSVRHRSARSMVHAGRRSAESAARRRTRNAVTQAA